MGDADRKPAWAQDDLADWPIMVCPVEGGTLLRIAMDREMMRQLVQHAAQDDAAVIRFSGYGIILEISLHESKEDATRALEAARDHLNAIRDAMRGPPQGHA